MTQKIAVLHHDDADGFGAAYVIWKELESQRDSLLFIPVQYHQPFPELPESIITVFILDFSYDRKTLLNLSSRYGVENVMVIDHHKSARNDLADLPFAVFDDDHSGAMLTWMHFTPFSRQAPIIIHYVEDRDLWRFTLPFSKEINAFIACMPRTFEAWDAFDVEMAMLVGEHIIDFQNKQIQNRAKTARIREFFTTGYLVPMVNATENVSELGNELCRFNPEANFAAIWRLEDQHIIYSLRSIGEFDVSKIAQQFGGGGHRNAAGFNVPVNKILNCEQASL